MDNFNVIYRILKSLEAAMDYDEFDMGMISPEKLGVTQNRWIALITQLVKSGYIDGISVSASADDVPTVSVSNPCVTIQGLEYLESNGFMKKAANFTKGIKEEITVDFSVSKSYLKRTADLTLTASEDVSNCNEPCESGETLNLDTANQRAIEILLEQLERIRLICKNENLRSVGAENFSGLSNAMANIGRIITVLAK